MKPPVRDQVNFLDDDKVEDPATVFSDEHLTEQQHEADTDINVIMRRFAQGMVPIQTAPLEYGERDFSIPTTAALEARARLREWYEGLAPSVRRTHRSPEEVLDAIATGRLVFKAPEASAGSSGDGSGASASESAPASAAGGQAAAQ